MLLHKSVYLFLRKKLKRGGGVNLNNYTCIKQLTGEPNNRESAEKKPPS